MIMGKGGGRQELQQPQKKKRKDVGRKDQTNVRSTSSTTTIAAAKGLKDGGEVVSKSKN